MTDFHGFIGAAKRLDDEDLPRIGAQIGVGEDELHAVLDVEAAGSGFDSLGRPKMLRETHVFYQQVPMNLRALAVNEGLATPKWVRNYHSESYSDLEKMRFIDEPSALRSCSWGRGQIMGFNHEAAGYDTPEEMILAFMDDEENHVQGMVNFIRANNLDRYLRTHQWDKFALGYNGSGYKENGYATKLADRYRWWQGKTDTLWRAPEAPAVSPMGSPIPTLDERVTSLEETVAFLGVKLDELERR